MYNISDLQDDVHRARTAEIEKFLILIGRKHMGGNPDVRNDTRRGRMVDKFKDQVQSGTFSAEGEYPTNYINADLRRTEMVPTRLNATTLPDFQSYPGVAQMDRVVYNSEGIQNRYLVETNRRF